MRARMRAVRGADRGPGTKPAGAAHNNAAPVRFDQERSGAESSVATSLVLAGRAGSGIAKMGPSSRRGWLEPSRRLPEAYSEPPYPARARYARPTATLAG